MSNYVSLAQNLPKSILQRIVPYLEKEESLPLNYTKYRTFGIYKLLVVCSTWRQAALKGLWSTLNLGVYTRERGGLANFHKWIHNYKLTHNTAGLVTELNVKLFITDIASGTAYKLMTEYMRGNQCFPAAQVVSFTILSRKIEHSYPRSVVISNAIAFVQLIKLLTPAATTFKVNCTSIPEELDEFDDQVFATIASSLCRHSKSVANSPVDAGPAQLSAVGSAPHLSSLHLCCENAQDLHAVLVHKFAHTLQSLDIGVCDPKVLLYDLNDTVVIYPLMQNLRVFRNMLPGQAKHLLVPNAVPFPTLKSLRLSMPFSFGDDVLFRGNSSTLEDLHLYIDKKGVMLLNRSRAFFHRFTSLRKVVVNDGYEVESLGLVPDDIMSRFLCRLSYSAQRLELSTTIATERLLTMVPRRLHLENVQELDLHAKALSLFAILKLLKAAPTLVKLTCDVSGLGPGFSHITPGEIPDYIVSAYGAVGGNLKQWFLPGVTNGERCIHITEYYMLVALACPRLEPFGLSRINIHNYHATIIDSLQSGPYSKHAPRLVRLMYGAM